MAIFLENWHNSSRTTLGLFWMAFWAFGLGYLVSSMIQVFVTKKRMKETMGESGARSVALGTFFGFISSSCSFAALSTTRSLFAKGAGLVPSLAFMLASTNLVIELGIIISVFMSWQFVVGEYAGGILLIVFTWIVVKLTVPMKWINEARGHAQEKTTDDDNEESSDWKTLIKSREGWLRVANQYCMEWLMVWKDVTIGFTVAGIIATFVPRAFFEALFVGSGTGDTSFPSILAQSMIGPVAAFFTFIGSMGNIPLAAVLFSNGVSFAGIIAFIFSDLVVFPVLRIQAKYYGWRMALYLIAVLLFVLILTSLVLHYGFSFAGLLPDPETARNVTDRDFFKVDYTLFLNVIFIAISTGFALWYWQNKDRHDESGEGNLTEKLLLATVILAICWLVGGVFIGII